jgi:hypothetical protein
MTTTKKKIPLLKSAFFWNKVADVFGLFGTGGLVTLDVNNAAQKWTWIVGSITAFVQVIRMLFTDSNRNNVPDILEDQEEISHQEVTVAVKENPEGGAPIVDVTHTTTTKP